LTSTGQVIPRDHVVLFYEDDVELARCAGDYLAQALRAGDVAIVIASPSHRRLLEAAVGAAGIDLAAADASESWVVLDAAETMRRFIFDGTVDAEAFETVVGDPIRRAVEHGGGVCAYGEMVALLWESGQINAALELEELWNDLGQRAPFSLFCAYATSSVADSVHAFALGEVCAKHSSVLAASPTHSGPAAGQVRARESTMTYPASPESIRRARQFARATLSDWGLDHLADDAGLVVSELASNSVHHVKSAFSLTVSFRASRVRIAIEDASDLPPVAREPTRSANSGRGLVLVAALSETWGVERSPIGKIVWADIRC
jgi:anti-sigma regulatory factor (Ser/Thr protein kinase)